MNKSEAGRRGGLATLKKYGRQYMIELARRGAKEFHRKYILVPQGINDFAICLRQSGEPTGKTINGRVLNG